MPLITERSINSWAEKLSVELKEPLCEVLYEICVAICSGAIEASISGLPISLPNLVETPAHPIVFTVLSATHPDLFNSTLSGEMAFKLPSTKDLDRFKITTADMTRWLRGRGVAWGNEPQPPSIPAAPKVVSEADIYTGPFKTKATESSLRPAGDLRTHEAIREVYSDEKGAGAKPSNVRQISQPVQDKLRARGLYASAARIRELAADPEHAACRRKPGATITSEWRKRNNPADFTK